MARPNITGRWPRKEPTVARTRKNGTATPATRGAPRGPRAAKVVWVALHIGAEDGPTIPGAYIEVRKVTSDPVEMLRMRLDDRSLQVIEIEVPGRARAGVVKADDLVQVHPGEAP